MSDLNIDPKQISESLKETLGNWSEEVKDDLVGYVASIADGVARVKGLENAMSSELLEFPGGLLGVALNLDVAYLNKLSKETDKDIENTKKIIYK